jgi:hypothetical protein
MGDERSRPRSEGLLTRREAIALGVGAGLGLLAAGSPGLGAAPPARARTGGRIPCPGHVVRVRMPGMRGDQFPRPEAARRMVDAAVIALSGETDPGRAWLSFVGPQDRVAIKVNCLGTRMASSMREIAFAAADAIRDAGVADANILVFDMFASNMMGGRYTVQSNPTRRGCARPARRARASRTSSSGRPPSSTCPRSRTTIWPASPAA